MTTSDWAAVAALSLLMGCGPTTGDLAQRDDQIRELEAQQREAVQRDSEQEREIQHLRERNESLSRLVTALSADTGTLEADREALRQSLERAQEAMESLEGSQSDLQARLSDARRSLDEVRAREQQARARLAQFRSMLEQLRSMIDAGHLRVRVVRNRMVVELPEAVLFDSGRADVKDDGEQVLRQLAPVLASLSGRHFQVAGHTDDRPIRTQRFPSNWELASKRALNVAHILMDAGLPAARLSAAGYADTQPIGDNETEEGRQQNRRIEVVLVPNLEELPDLSTLEEASQER